jgi:pimeloyl-ACP methyl ester carboxylesterase
VTRAFRRPRTVALTAALAGALAVTSCSGGSSTFIDQTAPRSPSTAPGATSSAPSSAPAPTKTPATPTVDKLQFSDCTSVIKPQVAGQEGGDRDLTFGCGRLRVPLDYTDPDGESVQIFVLRVHLAEQTQRIGSLLINPGGPGGSGLDAAVGLGLALPVELLKRFDLVGFDPRGVGLSGPLECVPDALKDRGIALDPDARTTAQYNAQVVVAHDAAKSCSDKYGASLAHYNTEETARDMELIRQAVGDDKLSYLGYSYGTRLGSVYADLFPAKVRALVLDGAVDPDQDDVSAAETQARGFENAYDQLSRDCARRGSACPIGPDAKASLRAVIAKARQAPIPSSKPGETRAATSGYVLLAAISALYDQGDWNDLENALARARDGDAQGIFTLADRYSQRDAKGHYTNIVDASVTINCTDSDTTITDATVRAKLSEWRTKYPLFGTSLALGMLSCEQWTGPRHPLPHVTGAGAPPILVIGTTNDPATPYASAQAMARQLKSGVLLTWDGEGHTAYPKTPCVTAAVDGYLISLKTPRNGTRCPRT